jgi:hypothetical protein
MERTKLEVICCSYPQPTVCLANADLFNRSGTGTAWHRPGPAWDIGTLLISASMLVFTPKRVITPGFRVILVIRTYLDGLGTTCDPSTPHTPKVWSRTTLHLSDAVCQMHPRGQEMQGCSKQHYAFHRSIFRAAVTC